MADQPDNLPALLRVDEAAAFLRISRSALYRLVSRRKILKTKVGGRTLFRHSELEKFLSRNTRWQP